jgi:hypothetical protein
MFSYAFDEQTFHGDFATREEAIAEAASEGGGDTFWTGENVPATQPEDWWVAEDWLEHVSCQDEYSGDHADGWDESTKEQRAELESLVRPILGEWLDRHSLRPSFFNVTNIKKHTADSHAVKN